MGPEGAAKETVLITGGGGYFGCRLVPEVITACESQCNALLLVRQQKAAGGERTGTELPDPVRPRLILGKHVCVEGRLGAEC